MTSENMSNENKNCDHQCNHFLWASKRQTAIIKQNLIILLNSILHKKGQVDQNLSNCQKMLKCSNTL